MEGPANMFTTPIKNLCVHHLQDVFRTVATRFGLFPAKTTKRVIKARFALCTDGHTHTYISICMCIYICTYEYIYIYIYISVCMHDICK